MRMEEERVRVICEEPWLIELSLIAEPFRNKRTDALNVIGVLKCSLRNEDREFSSGEEKEIGIRFDSRYYCGPFRNLTSEECSTFNTDFAELDVVAFAKHGRRRDLFPNRAFGEPRIDYSPSK